MPVQKELLMCRLVSCVIGRRRRLRILNRKVFYDKDGDRVTYISYKRIFIPMFIRSDWWISHSFCPRDPRRRSNGCLPIHLYKGPDLYLNLTSWGHCQQGCWVVRLAREDFGRITQCKTECAVVPVILFFHSVFAWWTGGFSAADLRLASPTSE